MAQRPDAAESADPDPLDAAARRLDRAIALLESRVRDLASRADSDTGGLFDFDRSNLASELDSARARERELEEVGAEASEALGRAIRDIRNALERTEPQDQG